jgi:hypothetical protein
MQTWSQGDLLSRRSLSSRLERINQWVFQACSYHGPSTTDGEEITLPYRGLDVCMHGFEALCLSALGTGRESATYRHRSSGRFLGSGEQTQHGNVYASCY